MPDPLKIFSDSVSSIGQAPATPDPSVSGAMLSTLSNSFEQSSSNPFRGVMARYGVADADLPEYIRGQAAESEESVFLANNPEIKMSFEPLFDEDSVSDRKLSAYASLVAARNGPNRMKNPQLQAKNLEQYKSDIGPAIELASNIARVIARKSGAQSATDLDEITKDVLGQLGIQDIRQEISEKISNINRAKNRSMFTSAGQGAFEATMGMSSLAARAMGDTEAAEKQQRAITRFRDMTQPEADANPVSRVIGGQLPAFAAGMGVGAAGRGVFTALSTKSPALARTLASVSTAAPSAAVGGEVNAAARIGAGERQDVVREQQLQDFLATVGLTGLFGVANAGGLEAVLAGQGSKAVPIASILTSGTAEFLEEFTDESLQAFVGEVRNGATIEAAAGKLASTMPERAATTFQVMLPFMLATTPSMYIQNKEAADMLTARTEQSSLPRTAQELAIKEEADIGRAESAAAAQRDADIAASEGLAAVDPLAQFKQAFADADQELDLDGDTTPAPLTEQEQDVIEDAQATVKQADNLGDSFRAAQVSDAAPTILGGSKVRPSPPPDRTKQLVKTIDAEAKTLTDEMAARPDANRRKEIVDRLDRLRVLRVNLLDQNATSDAAVNAAEKSARTALSRVGGEEQNVVVKPPATDGPAQRRLEQTEVKKLGAQQRREKARAAGSRLLADERQLRRERARVVQDISAGADLLVDAQKSNDPAELESARQFIASTFTPDQAQDIQDLAQARAEREPVRTLEDGINRRIEDLERGADSLDAVFDNVDQDIAQSDTEVSDFTGELDQIDRESANIDSDPRTAEANDLEERAAVREGVGLPLSARQSQDQAQGVRFEQEAERAFQDLDTEKTNDDEALLRQLRSDIQAQAEARLASAIQSRVDQGDSRAVAEQDFERETAGVMELRAQARDEFERVVEFPRELLKAAKKRVAWPRTVAEQKKLGGEYDGFKALPDNLKRAVRNTVGGSAPDQLAMELYSQGVLDSPDVNGMWEAIRDAEETVASARDTFKRRQQTIPEEVRENRRTPNTLEKENRRLVDDAGFTIAADGPTVTAQEEVAREARIVDGTTSAPVRAWARMIRDWVELDGSRLRVAIDNADVLNKIIGFQPVKSVPKALRDMMNSDGKYGLPVTEEEVTDNASWERTNATKHVRGVGAGGLMTVQGDLAASAKNLESAHDDMVANSPGFARKIRVVSTPVYQMFDAAAKVVSGMPKSMQAIVSRVERASPEVGQRVRRAARYQRNYRGQANKTLFDFQRLAGGWGSKIANTPRTILDSSALADVYNPNDSGIWAESVFQAAVEGRYPLDDLSSRQREMVTKYRELIMTSGKWMEDAGLQIKLNDGSTKPFKASQDGMRYLRQLHPEAAQKLAHGDTEFIDAVSTALATANPNHATEVAAVVKQIQESALTRSSPMESARKLPVMPSYVSVNGEWVPLLNTSPFKAGAQIVGMSSLRAGFVKEFGQLDDDANYMEEAWAKTLARSTGDTTIIRHLVRAMNGLPIYEMDAKSWARPNTFLWHVGNLYESYTRFTKALNLSGGIVSNTFEIAGSVWAHGLRANIGAIANLTRGFTDKQGLYGKKGQKYTGISVMAEAQASISAVSRDVLDMTITDDGLALKIRGMSGILSNLVNIGSLMQTANEFLELFATLSARNLVDQITDGSIPADRLRARLIGQGFVGPQLERLTTRKYTQDDLRDVVSRAPGSLQGANTLPVELSSVEQAKLYRKTFAFTSFSTKKAAALYLVTVGPLREGLVNISRVATTKDRKQAAVAAANQIYVASSFLFGNLAGGALAKGARLVINSNTAGLLVLWNMFGELFNEDQYEDEEVSRARRQALSDFMMESMAYAVAGAPLQSASAAAVSMDSETWLDPLGPLSGSVYVYRQFEQGKAALLGEGAYRGLDLVDRIGLYFLYQSPGTAVLDSAVNYGGELIGVTSLAMSDRMIGARKQYWKAARAYDKKLRDEGRKSTSQTDTIDLTMWSKLRRQLRDAIDNQESPREMERIIYALINEKKELNDMFTDRAKWGSTKKRNEAKKSVRQVLRNMRMLEGKDTDFRNFMRGYVGDDVMNILQTHDAIVNKWIKRI